MNSEHVGEIAIVSLRPEVRIVARINQLCVDANAVGRALDAAFEQICYAKLFSDLAQIARDSSPILHHRCATDYFQGRDLCEVSQDFILHAVGEERVLFLVAQVFKRKDGDAFLRNCR